MEGPGVGVACVTVVMALLAAAVEGAGSEEEMAESEDSPCWPSAPC